MPEIAIAERAGVGADGHPRPTEDHVVVLDNAVLVLDGATSPDPSHPPVGWYAERLAQRLADDLRAAPEADLTETLTSAIAAVTTENALQPRQSPSSTVAAVRWLEDRVDALVLADSPVVGFGGFGVDVVSDDRLARLRRRGVLPTGADVPRRGHAPGGFWGAEAGP